MTKLGLIYINYPYTLKIELSIDKKDSRSAVKITLKTVSKDGAFPQPFV